MIDTQYIFFIVLRDEEKMEKQRSVLLIKKLQQLKCSIREREFFLCHVNEEIRKDIVSSELKK
jgi:hypothetical protein